MYARRLHHIGEPHDVEFNRRIGVALRPQGQERISRGVHNRLNATARNGCAQRERTQYIAFNQINAIEINDIRQHIALQTLIHHQGTLSCIHQNFCHLRAD